MVRFRVQKGSAFAFECCSREAQQVQSDDIQQLFTRAEDLEALEIKAVSIAKRLDLADVDKMITLCRQHPPQCVVGPASAEHTLAFQEFTAYLKQRQRAGVATLANGFMLLLTPIPNWDSYLRCLVIKSNVSEMDAESVSSLSSVRSEGEESRSHMVEEVIARSPKRRKITAKPESAPASVASAPVTESAAVPPREVLSPRSRDARFVQLREEYRAFNSRHLQALQEWIAKQNQAATEE